MTISKQRLEMRMRILNANSLQRVAVALRKVILI